MRIPKSVLVCAVLAATAAAQIELPPALRGTYRVDATGKGPDVFRDLATAVKFLGLIGVAGDFELILEPGTYSGTLFLLPVRGQKEGQKIVVRARRPGSVRLDAPGTILDLMGGCRDFVFDGLTFAGSGGEPAVLLRSGVQGIEFRACRFLRESGGLRVFEAQRNVEKVEIHHSAFELGAGQQQGIYTQGTRELFIHHNDFDCAGGREPISIWNSNKSGSRIHDNVFRGEVSYTGLRLDVSGHDVDVYRNLFLLRMGGPNDAVIASKGLAGAWNRIHHNLFVVLGSGAAVRTRGPLAIDANTYAFEEGPVGRVNNDVSQTIEAWRQDVAADVVGEAGDQNSVVAGKGFFGTYRRLIEHLHPFDRPAAAEVKQLAPEQEAARRREAVRFLIAFLTPDADPAALRLAMYGLRRYGRYAAPAVPALGRLCAHAHPPVRADAAILLGEVQVGAEIVVPELIRLLADGDRFVVLASLGTLGRFAHLARQAEPEVRRLVGHKDEGVQAAAKAALRAISGTDRKDNDKKDSDK